MDDQIEKADEKKRWGLIAGDDITLESMLALFEMIVARKATAEEIAELQAEWFADEDPPGPTAGPVKPF